MFRYELKRILKGKVFIVVMFITVLYFIYLNVVYYKTMYSDDYKALLASEQETNSYLAQLKADCSADESMLMTLRKRRAELRDEEHRLFDELVECGAMIEQENADGSISYYEADPMPPKYQEKFDRYKEAIFEYDLLTDATSVMEYQLDTFPSLMEDTLKKAMKLANDPTQDEYTIRLNCKAIDKYNIKRTLSFIVSAPAHRWHENYTLMYEYFYIFLPFVFLFIAADAFCSENTYLIEGMVYTSKYGRRRLFGQKLVALITIACAIMLFFTITDVIVAYNLIGKQLLLEPIQIMSEYQNSTAGFSILSMILATSALRLLLIVFTIALAGAISQISRKVFVSVMIDCIIMFAVFALYVYSSGYMVSGGINTAESIFDSQRFELYERLRSFLPTCLVNPFAYLEKFDYINVANYPITRLTTCLTVTIALTLVFTVFAYFRFGNVLKFIPYKTKDIAKVKEAK